MKINRYSIDSLSKLAVIFITIFSVLNSVSAQTVNPSSDSASPEKTQIEELNSTLQNETEKIKQQLTQLETNLNESLEKIGESLNNKNSFSILDSLLYIDLPIAAILLLLWFLNQNQQKKQVSELIAKQDQIEKRLKELKDNNLTRNDIEKIERKIIKQFQENNQKITDSKIEILGTLHKNRTDIPVDSLNNIGIDSNNHHGFSTSTTEQVEPQLDAPSYTPVAVADPVPQFVERYNLDKNTLFNEAIAKVVTTEASITKRRLGDEGKLTLENTTQKKYLIVQEDGNFYLVPHAKIKIDEYNITTLEALFECINFTPEYSDFHLIQPAKVSQLDSELWQLDKNGKLEFS